MNLFALGGFSYTADAAAGHVAVWIETAHVFFKSQAVSVAVFDIEEWESTHRLHVGMRETGQNFIGARTFFFRLIKRLKKM